MRTLIVLSALTAMFSLAGNMDYQDAKAQDSHYIEMVCEGTWPDYDNHRPDCDLKMKQEDI